MNDKPVQNKHRDFSIKAYSFRAKYKTDFVGKLIQMHDLRQNSLYVDRSYIEFKYYLTDRLNEHQKTYEIHERDLVSDKRKLGRKPKNSESISILTDIALNAQTLNDLLPKLSLEHRVNIASTELISMEEITKLENICQKLCKASNIAKNEYTSTNDKATSAVALQQYILSLIDLYECCTAHCEKRSRNKFIRECIGHALEGTPKCAATLEKLNEGIKRAIRERRRQGE
ncbi:hypothetical protein [Simiduia aestuariiviva]|uniref:Uncharacterized protein n=1 Tax=Simiduia aestuariiviva TaxID=1510459 RepID=A0A839UWY7_9GAMM|nr:hypothetical protein [Simiduia aestuariiviva]MBB3169968.1 hypothetical protein [Simiduia aestuariiviva]